MDLHQIDHIRLQPLQRLLELLARARGGAPVELGHHEGLLAIPVAQRLAHPLLGIAVVVVPAVVEEVHAVIERGAHDADRLFFRGEAEMIAAEAEDRNPHAGSAQLARLHPRIRCHLVLAFRHVSRRRAARLLFLFRHAVS